MIESNTLKWSPICHIKANYTFNEQCMQHFAYLHLKCFLSSSVEFSKTAVIEIHTKRWTSSCIPSSTQDHIKEILSVIPVQNVVDMINEMLTEVNFSWKYMFIIISVLTKDVNGALIVKGAVDKWLTQAFEENNYITLYLALLVARHCCYEKARYFQSYASWFSSLCFKNAKSFSSFFKFLIEILPFEPPLYLKIHLNKVPSAPAGCQSLLVDYILLAKTRLTDLNETGEYIGIFSDYHETDEQGQQADVARVIAYYEEHKEIAKPLLEAYILRRQYYEKVFLRQLLKVPECEDKKRAEVIHKLHSMGRIPPTLYHNWTIL